MKWTYIVQQKTRAAIVLAVVFGLMLITNRLDKSSFSELQTSFASVYQDRLLAESYIYQLSGLLYQRSRLINEPARAEDDLLRMRTAANESIAGLITQYTETQLTKTETYLFDDLQQQLVQLQALEAYAGPHDRAKFQRVIEKQYQALFAILDGLSAVQLTETKSIVADSNRIIAASETISQLEIGVLIVAGLIMQALILASKSEFSRFPQQSSLN